MPAPFSRVAVVGTGLIGGSFALAARSALCPERASSAGTSPQCSIVLSPRGVVDEGHAELADAVAGADLDLTSRCPSGWRSSGCRKSRATLAAGALVTDACSTKRAICAAPRSAFPDGSALSRRASHGRKRRFRDRRRRCGALSRREVCVDRRAGRDAPPRISNAPNSADRASRISCA